MPLTTPPSMVIDAGGTVDAEPAAPIDAAAPDAMPPEAPPDQLLAIGLWGYPQGDTVPGTLILRRQIDGSWYPVTDAAGPEWNFNDVD